MPSVTAGTCNRFVGFVTILQTNTVVHGIKPQHATNCALFLLTKPLLHQTEWTREMR